MKKTWSHMILHTLMIFYILNHAGRNHIVFTLLENIHWPALDLSILWLISANVFLVMTFAYIILQIFRPCVTYFHL